jgi:hypothetical protein
MALFYQSSNFMNMTNHDHGGSEYIINIQSYYNNINNNNNAVQSAGRVDKMSTQVSYRFTSHEPRMGLYNNITTPFYINTTSAQMATHLMPLPVPEP